MALNLTENVKYNMSNFMSRPEKLKTRFEKELFGDMLATNSKDKMQLLTNLESTRDDKILERDEDGDIINSLGDTSGTALVHSFSEENPHGIVSPIDKQEQEYQQTKALIKTTADGKPPRMTQDRATRTLDDIEKGNSRKSTKPIDSTYKFKISKLKQRLAVQYRAFTNSSSFVGNIRYDQDEQSMTGILSGKHYQWCGVPESKFDSFQGAGSAGAFFNRDIKGQYDCSSVGKLNEVQSRLSQLQKFAVDYSTGLKSRGADMDAIRAFKAKGKYTSGANHATGSKFKWRSDGQTLFLHDNAVARHHKDGIEISNAGYDTNLTYRTHQALGINSQGSVKHPKGLATLGTKEIDKNSGEWVLVNHSDVLADPILPKSSKTKSKQPKRDSGEQANFNSRATKKELKEQGKKSGKPLSKVNIQKTDQRIINALSKVKKPLPTDKLGVDAHHLLEYAGDGGVGEKLQKNKTVKSEENNSIMIPKDYHNLLTNFKNSSPQTNLNNLRQMDSKIKQLKGKLQKIAGVNSSILGNNDMEEKDASYDWNTGEELTIEQIHSKGDGRDVFAVAVTKDLDKNSDFREPEKYINNDFGVKKLGLVKGIYTNKKGMKEHDRTYLFHGSEDEVQEQLNLHNGVNKGVAQEEAGKIYKDTDGIVKYDSIRNKKFK